MASVPNPDRTVGPAAGVYELPDASVIERMCAPVFLQPTATRFRLPAVCAAVKATVTTDCAVCGSASLPCTYAMGGACALPFRRSANVISAAALAHRVSGKERDFASTHTAI